MIANAYANDDAVPNCQHPTVECETLRVKNRFLHLERVSHKNET